MVADSSSSRSSAWAAFGVDLGRYCDPDSSIWCRLREIVATEAIWILFLFRLGQWIGRECPPGLATLLKLAWKPTNTLLSNLLDTHLEPGATIGPGLYIGHHGGVWVNPCARLGAYCNIAQGVVIGAASGHRAPQLGDRVWVGPHAVVSGPIRLGDESVVGANSLVVSDVPDRGLAVGVPARIIAGVGSARLINARGSAAAPGPAAAGAE